MKHTQATGSGGILPQGNFLLEMDAQKDEFGEFLRHKILGKIGLNIGRCIRAS